jgi:hypothetical protein
MFRGLLQNALLRVTLCYEITLGLPGSWQEVCTVVSADSLKKGFARESASK